MDCENQSKKRSWKENKQQKKERKKQKLLKTLEKQKEKEEVETKVESEVVHQKGRNWTVSIAFPSSIVDNAQSEELKTYLCGQIARAAVVFNVDEIVVFDEYATLKVFVTKQIFFLSDSKS